MEASGPVQNVIVFGEAGVGKSSIINLVVGSRVAKTSPDATACTIHTHPYDIIIDGKIYRLWDTPGLDGGTLGRFRAAIAERKLKTFLRNHLKKKNETPLLIYCIRASRAKRALVRHYQSVRLATQTRENPVPMVVVVTGLENALGDMENWWDRNAADLSNHGMEFVDHACITSIDDDSRDLELARTRRRYSQGAVRDLVSRNCFPRDQCENTMQHAQAIEKRDDPGRWSGAIGKYLVSTLLWLRAVTLLEHCRLDVYAD